MVIQSAPYRQWAVANQHVSLLWLRALSSGRHMAVGQHPEAPLLWWRTLQVPQTLALMLKLAT